MNRDEFAELTVDEVRRRASDESPSTFPVWLRRRAESAPKPWTDLLSEMEENEASRVSQLSDIRIDDHYEMTDASRYAKLTPEKLERLFRGIGRSKPD